MPERPHAKASERALSELTLRGSTQLALVIVAAESRRPGPIERRPGVTVLCEMAHQGFCSGIIVQCGRCDFQSKLNGKLRAEPNEIAGSEPKAHEPTSGVKAWQGAGQRIGQVVQQRADSGSVDGRQSRNR